MKHHIQKIAFSIAALLSPFLAVAAGTTEASKAASVSWSMDINLILCIVAVVLLLPLYLASKTFLLVAETQIRNKIKNAKNTAALVFLFVLSQNTFAQEAVTTAQPLSPAEPSYGLTWALIVLIFFEATLIAYFSLMAMRMAKPETLKARKVDGIIPEHKKNWFVRAWEKMNRFQPVAEESHLDTGHSYDGIRELNNITPPWFSTSFIITILISGVYLYVYHVAKSAPLPEEEYAIEMREAEREKMEMLSVQGNNVDENTVVMLGSSDIASGQKIFVEKCAACHGDNGASKPGGVGPNLTDNFWIHGGSLKDIFKSIKYGWVEKGMISWKDQLSAKQIAQITSYIRSIQGSNPTGAKEAQGEMYTESTDISASDSTTTK